MTVKTKGFTPLFDVLVDNKKYGIVGASIFGAAWRHTQMRRGVCDASLETIAQTAGVSVRSCIRYLDKLLQDEYLKDTTPELRNKPHRYTDTGKVQIEVEVAMTESHSAMTRSHCDYDSESLEDTNKIQERIAAQNAASLKEFRESFPIREETVIVNPKTPQDKGSRETRIKAALQKHFSGKETLTEALHEITGREISDRNKTQSVYIANLREWGATPSTLEYCADYCQRTMNTNSDGKKWREEWKPSLQNIWENYRASQAAPAVKTIPASLKGKKVYQ